MSTDSEDEDDEGVLASVAVDKQIQTTLDAIRSKDPRVYDKNAQFFAAYHSEEDHDGTHTGSVKEKPMYLSDYHRKNIQENVANLSKAKHRATYAKQQDDLKSTVIREMHGAIGVASGNSAENPNGGQITDNEDDDFLVRKNPLLNGEGEKKDPIAPPALDAKAADKDPESFLSNFMASRAWVPSAESKFQPFESDDDEEEQRAEQYEEAYNLRFEDPQKSNEKLLSHARDAAAKYSVRREAVNGRKRARDIERAKKEAARKDRQEEKARLRKLRIAEAEEKIKRIKDAAGLRDKSLRLEDWSVFLNEGWDDKRWEEEMKKRFGDAYYADYDYESNHEEPRHGKKRAKKPKWNDDLQINDLIPEFEADEAQRLATEFVLTDDESPRRSAFDARDYGQEIIPEQNISKTTSKKKSKRISERMQNKQARIERRQVEWLVDQQLDVDQSLANVGPRHSRYFRYRETSPLNFGLTAQDILMASDSQLNQYAGLKKIASFREPEKKRKDKRRLGKKARLRKWRKDTFGDEQGSQKTLNDVLTSQTTLDPAPTRKKGEGNGIGQFSRRRQSQNAAIER